MTRLLVPQQSKADTPHLVRIVIQDPVLGVAEGGPARSEGGSASGPAVPPGP